MLTLERPLLIILVGCLVGCATEEGTTKLADLVPDEVSEWRRAGDDRIYDRESIFEYIDGAGEVYRQYSFRSVFVRTFQRAGSEGITVQLFDMGSPEDAFGIFSFEREDEDAGIGQGSEYAAGLLRFWKGQFLVCVSAEIETAGSRGAAFELGKKIAEAIRRPGNPPILLDALPPEGVRTNSVRYFHGPFCLTYHYSYSDRNLLSLGDDTDSLLASYRFEDGTARLLVVRYADAAKAAAALDAFSRGYEPPLGDNGIVATAGGLWVGARRHGLVVAVVFEATTKTQLESLLARTGDRLEDAPWAR